ncbi:MAG: helix-turn-helix domain-containing protein [Acidimicrobiales bacterium]|nr:helix-turn-helix domain-containing protein [Acidimicrobiales bacterium]
MRKKPAEMSEESPEITYERWYPDVPAVIDSKELAELLSTSDQIVRIWAREGVIPSHRAPGARKFRFLRHEIFEWLVENRYEPTDMEPTTHEK